MERGSPRMVVDRARTPPLLSGAGGDAPAHRRGAHGPRSAVGRQRPPLGPRGDHPGPWALPAAATAASIGATLLLGIAVQPDGGLRDRSPPGMRRNRVGRSVLGRAGVSLTNPRPWPRRSGRELPGRPLWPSPDNEGLPRRTA